MLQEVMTAPKKIEFREIADAAAGSGQILIRVMRIGICGSDIHVYHGTHPFTSYPVTQGHEVSGKVLSVGENVTGFQIGQKVTFQPQVVCGNCYPCTHGKYNICENLKVMGFQTTGAASELFAIDAAKAMTLPDDMSYDEGAMIEPLAVAVHAAKRFPNLDGAKVAVIGAGPIGNLVAQSVKGLGAEKVMITDISSWRLNKAKECGADYIVNTSVQDFGEAMVSCFGTDKADVIYDCAGNDITMGQAIRNARKGSTIILVAVYAGIAKIDLAILNDHELDLNTTMMYLREDYADAIRLVNEEKIKLRPLISKHFDFTDYLKAYEFIDENREKAMKVIIDVSK
ncbi:MAG: alcohol dehydrogenase catalytic domain-containing protein [Lachnospiraceae bacterium]|jgi:L-iditol 2-dehydrogenase|nr:alcohol dehydrogenase catalytic domain-containing protein [Lachnospiraceae bacterium]